MSKKTPLLGCVFILATAAAARADEAYYLVIFSAQHPANQPKYAHTFATFVKVPDRADPKTPIAATTISWLPATGVVDVVRLRPEPGRNFNLEETLKWCATEGDRVSAWGAFPIKKELYESGLRRAKYLESGAALYKAIEFLRAKEAVVNCMHAVCDLDITKEFLVTGKARGDEASAMIARFLAPWYVAGPAPPAWLDARLGLANYPITHRSLEPNKE